MPATLEPLKAIKCSYEDCYQSFDTKEEMIRHKKYSEEHEYCSKCDLDCEDLDAYVLHKITAPLQHKKACRHCGDEFHTKAGLERHIALVR